MRTRSVFASWTNKNRRLDWPEKSGCHYSFLCFEQWAQSGGEGESDCIRRGTARFRSCAEIIERLCLRTVE